MKHVFLAAFALLFLMGVVTVITEPNQSSDVPVLYWVTDANPARYEQIDLFHQWLIDNGYVTDDGRPIMELRLDTASADNTKKIVQSIAGVAGDIMDCDLALMHDLGVLEDVTDAALELGFDPSQTYEAIAPNLVFEGRQYGFPCNVATMVMWGNAETFAAYGMDLPPQVWDIDAFEAYGREFVAKANADNPPQRIFFCESLAGWQSNSFLQTMLRSDGLSFLNETMTQSRLDDPRFQEVLERFYRWTYEDNLAPTAAQESSFSSESGYGGGALSLFQSGRYGMIFRGRWGLIRVREFADPPQVSVSMFPHSPGGFRNLSAGARMAGVYAGGEHKELAVLFLAFLASESYSQQIVDSADALPPMRELTQSEEFRQPADFPNEWGTHEPIAEAFDELAIAGPISPFVPPSYVWREVTIARDHVMTNNRVKTPEEAVADCARAINEEIARGIAEDNRLRQLYEELTATQARIDAYRAEGRKVPLEWITNPFYRVYYVEMGWSDPPVEQREGGSS